jgi:hypothetical protein
MSLAVETVSAYLLCCALADGGAPITVENLTPKWQGSQEELLQRLDELAQRNIVTPQSIGYQLNPSTQWRSI